MLKMAKVYEDSLIKLYLSHITDERNKYLSYSYITGCNIEDNDWNSIQRVILYNNKIIGYVSADVHRALNKIDQLFIISFAKSYSEKKQFEYNLLQYILFLLKNFRKIKWSCCVKNPVRKSYLKLINTLNGKIVGREEKEVIIDGEEEDIEIYEILKSKDTLDILKKLISRFERSLNNV